MSVDGHRVELLGKDKRLLDHQGPVGWDEKVEAYDLARPCNLLTKKQHPGTEGVQVFRHAQEVGWDGTILDNMMELSVPVRVRVVEEVEVLAIFGVDVGRLLANVLVDMLCELVGRSETNLGLELAVDFQTNLLNGRGALQDFLEAGHDAGAIEEGLK